MQQLHQIQMQILKKLLFAEFLTYTELRPDNIENNQYSYHLDELLKQSLVEKTKNGYCLTMTGKESANRMDTDSKLVKKQAKVSVVCCAFRMYDGNQQVLIYTRQKQPFYGNQGFLSGKVEYGEQILTAASRELEEETGLVGRAELVGIRHYRVFSTEQKLLEDKIMFFCKFDSPNGELFPGDEGLYEWVDMDDVRKYIKKPFHGFWGIYNPVVNWTGGIDLVEEDSVVEEF